MHLNPNSYTPNSFTQSVELTHSASQYCVKKCGDRVVKALNHTEESALSMAAGITKGAMKVGSFIHQNWKTLVIYAVAWGLIIVSSGILYGFKSTALPLTIGMSAGMGFGLLTSLILITKKRA